jgi:dihydrofolate reductase
MELIAAITDNFVIGAGGDMPWHLPADLAHFKKVTSGNTIVMGRRTWESIGRALPNRLNIVLTRQKDFVAECATVIHSLEELCTVETRGVLFIIGGGELYKNAINVVDKLHITRIHTTLEGDTFFPQIDKSIWTCEESVRYPKDDKNPFDLSFETWVKD